MIDARPGAEVLLVEDSSTDAELCLRTLRKLSLAHVFAWVKDGEEALNYLFGTGGGLGSEPLPRLILLDLHLPKVNGLEVLQRIKQDENTRYIPTVVLTSSKVDRDIVESYGLGANSFISKPVEFDAFIETVSRAGLYWLVVNQPLTLSDGAVHGVRTGS